MKLNETIKQIRINLGLSQTAFAKKLHVSFSTVNRWENDRVQPNRLAMVAIIALAEQNKIDAGLLEILKKADIF